MGRLQDKVAIVTGAGRGIGKAIATRFAEEGAKVVVASRTPATVNSVTRQINEAGGTALGVPCDVSEKDQVFAMVDRAVSEFGTVDILVNNAQGFGTKRKPQTSTVFVAVEDTNDDEVYYTFTSGCMAMLWGMNAVYPHMKKNGGGHIINFASTAGMEGQPGNLSYNIAKESIRALTRTAAREWGVHNILINTICPSLKTDAFEAWEAARPEFVRAIREAIPLKRHGDPYKDGTPICLFLASENTYLTGMTFILNGGRIMP
jgi:NAD(P)-dependent dehydrogenase (short-subunit alcohol dehydrogenase family)